MSESKTITQFKKAIRLSYPDLFFYKIPDSGRGESFVVPKPFDAFAFHNGKPYCFEFKYQKKPMGISPSILRPSQHEGLTGAERAEATALVVIEQKQCNGKYWLFTFQYRNLNKAKAYKKGLFTDEFFRDLYLYDFRESKTGHTYNLDGFLK